MQVFNMQTVEEVVSSRCVLNAETLVHLEVRYKILNSLQKSWLLQANEDADI